MPLASNSVHVIEGYCGLSFIYSIYPNTSFIIFSSSIIDPIAMMNLLLAIACAALIYNHLLLPIVCKSGTKIQRKNDIRKRACHFSLFFLNFQQFLPPMQQESVCPSRNGGVIFYWAVRVRILSFCPPLSVPGSARRLLLRRRQRPSWARGIRPLRHGVCL